MARTTSQYQVAPFTTPINATTADADQVRGNDNTVRTSVNSHDADSGVHLQSSSLATRPAAGTAGRKWFTEDGFRLYYDDGSAWQEAAYLPIVGGTVTGAVTYAGGLTVSTLTGTTSLGLVSTGSNAINFTTNGTTRWSIGATGHLTALTDNAFDIGSAGASRPRSLFLGTDLTVGGAYSQSGGTGAFAVSTSGAVSLTSSAASSLQLTQSNAGGAIVLNSSGANGQVYFYTAGLSRASIDNTGTFAPGATASYDLGTSSFAWRALHIGNVKVSNTQVVAARQTGWTAATGTGTKTTFATGSVTLPVLAEHVKALIDDLITHGLIGT